MAEYDEMYYINDTDDKRNGNKKSIVIPNRTGSALQSKQKDKSLASFVSFDLPRNYNILRYLGLNKQQALARAADMSMQHGLESSYGRSYAAINRNNRSGLMSNGKTINYATPDLHDIAIAKSYMNNPNWMRAIHAPNSAGYFYQLQHPNEGEHAYEANMSGTNEYHNKIQAAKTYRKIIEDYFKSGITKNWTMNLTRRDLEDMPVLA